MDNKIKQYIEHHLMIIADDIDLHEVNDFKNEVFEMHQYRLDIECDCGIDDQTQKIDDANPCTKNYCGVGIKEVHYVCNACKTVENWKVNNPHLDSCATLIPNFKCGDIEITWYKHIGRCMEVNREVTKEELLKMFNKCENSYV